MDISSLTNNADEKNIQIVLAGPMYCFTTQLPYRHFGTRRILYVIDVDAEAYLMKYKSVPGPLLDKLRAKHGSAIQATNVHVEYSPRLNL